MSVAEAAHRPAHTGRTVALWLAFLVIVAAAIGLAWVGAGSLRPEVTASGLQFRTIKTGKGEPIGPQDAALLDYILTTDDGQVFDASQNHGGPQPFNMAMVFPGFDEAMSRMHEGGRYRFVIPEKLAFKDKSPPGWPNGSALHFEVQVRKIVRGGAALMGGAPAAPQQAEPAEQAPPPGQQPQQ